MKTASQQYVLEHCEATGMAFTSGFDGSILSFTIETRSTTSSSVDGEQQQSQHPTQQQQQPQPHILASATQIGEQKLAAAHALSRALGVRHSPAITPAPERYNIGATRATAYVPPMDHHWGFFVG